MKTQTAVSTWIDCRDEMPDSDQTVLIFCPDETEPVFMGFHDGEQWVTVELVPVRCTFWMPLPEPPEGWQA